jgi:hypothetical protein
MVRQQAYSAVVYVPSPPYTGIFRTVETSFRGAALCNSASYNTTTKIEEYVHRATINTVLHGKSQRLIKELKAVHDTGAPLETRWN